MLTNFKQVDVIVLLLKSGANATLIQGIKKPLIKYTVQNIINTYNCFITPGLPGPPLNEVQCIYSDLCMVYQYTALLKYLSKSLDKKLMIKMQKLFISYKGYIIDLIGMPNSLQVAVRKL